MSEQSERDAALARALSPVSDEADRIAEQEMRFEARQRPVSVLVVIAHPDDESFWCGGTIAVRTQAGERVHVVALADGCGSRPGTEVAQREAAFRDACGILGATCQNMIVFPDQLADTVSQLKINRNAEFAVRLHQPSIVYTHHVGDLNLDHRRVAEAVLVATRPGSGVQMVCHMRPEWPERCIGPAWKPTAFSRIGAVVEQKRRACQCYTAELRGAPHPRAVVQGEVYERFMVTPCEYA